MDVLRRAAVQAERDESAPTVRRFLRPSRSRSSRKSSGAFRTSLCVPFMVGMMRSSARGDPLIRFRQPVSFQAASTLAKVG